MNTIADLTALATTCLEQVPQFSNALHGTFSTAFRASLVQFPIQTAIFQTAVFMMKNLSIGRELRVTSTARCSGSEWA